MKMANHDCCEKKHCKCRGFLKFVFGAGVLGLLAHMVYGYLEEDKPCPLKDGWLSTGTKVPLNLRISTIDTNFLTEAAARMSRRLLHDYRSGSFLFCLL